MKIPSWIQLVKNLYPNTEDSLLRILNEKMSLIFKILNKGLSFTDNMNCDVKTITFTKTETTFPMPIKISNNRKPLFVLVGSIQDLSSPTVGNTLILGWEYSSYQIVIKSLTGFTPLTNNKTYELKLIIINE